MAGIITKAGMQYRLNGDILQCCGASNEWTNMSTLPNARELILKNGRLGYIGKDGKTYLENWDGTGFTPEKETSKTEKKQKKDKKKKGCLSRLIKWFFWTVVIVVVIGGIIIYLTQE